MLYHVRGTRLKKGFVRIYKIILYAIESTCKFDLKASFLCLAIGNKLDVKSTLAGCKLLVVPSAGATNPNLSILPIIERTIFIIYNNFHLFICLHFCHVKVIICRTVILVLDVQIFNFSLDQAPSNILVWEDVFGFIK